VVAGWNHPHYVEPMSTENRVVWGLNVDHEELCDDIVWIGADREIMPEIESRSRQTRTSWIEFED